MSTSSRCTPPTLLAQLSATCDAGARWILLTDVLGLPGDHLEVLDAHRAVLADPRTRALVDRLVPWDRENPVSGHNRPEYAPNLLSLLLDIGVGPADVAEIATCLASMLDHQAPDGRFLALGRAGRGADLAWAALPCDHRAILEVLLRTDHRDDPRVRTGLQRLEHDLTPTRQGPGWTCLPDPQVAFRGPGRRGDVCPQVTLEALRALSWLPQDERPPEVEDAARTALGVWRRRSEERPYMFGHGRSFKEGKSPPTWYSALAVVDTVGRFPAVWSGPSARPEDTRALAEVAACLRAYCVEPDGTVAPRSVYRGFEEQDVGVRGRPSAILGALVARALHRVEPIAQAVDAVDVLALPGAGAGGGTARPPRTARV